VQRSIGENAVKAVLTMLQALAIRRRKLIIDRVQGVYPGSDLGVAYAEEDRREVIFRKRVEERMRAGMKLATAASDPSARMIAIEKVMRRERRFAEMRSVAAGERVLAAAELQDLRQSSPQGAFWSLGARRQSTPDCIAMNGKFWPWSVLEKVHPLMHVGCGCYLLSFGSAISQGRMKPGDLMSEATALRLAAPVIKHVEEEAAAAERKYGHLAESAYNELLARGALLDRRAANPDLLALAPLGADEAMKPVALSEAEEQTGAMVALYPTEAQSKKLAITGGTKPEELHVTLAFLGKAANSDYDAALAATEAWAKKTPKLSGKLSGIGHFDVGGGEKVTYRSVDLPDLGPHREGLVADLEQMGAPASTDHGFTPHMTIDGKVRRPPVKQQAITFSHVTLAWGGERQDFPLVGKPPASKP
jgi:2'-5' RNA ligase